MESAETRTVKKVDKYSIYFHETPGLSIDIAWCPDAQPGQKLELTIDYASACIGKVVNCKRVEVSAQS